MLIGVGHVYPVFQPDLTDVLYLVFEGMLVSHYLHDLSFLPERSHPSPLLPASAIGAQHADAEYTVNASRFLQLWLRSRRIQCATILRMGNFDVLIVCPPLIPVALPVMTAKA